MAIASAQAFFRDKSCLHYNLTARDSIGSSETSERKHLQLAHSTSIQQHYSHAQLIMNHMHMCMVCIILLGFSTAACISATVYCINSLLAFIQLLFMHVSAACLPAYMLSCICCMVVCFHASSRGIAPLVLQFVVCCCSYYREHLLKFHSDIN